MPNYYKILNLNPDCTFAEISTAFKKTSFVWHPDRFIEDSLAQLRKIKLVGINSTSTEQECRQIIQENYDLIVEAKEVLQDPIKRKNFHNQLQDEKERDADLLRTFNSVAQKGEPPSEFFFQGKCFKKVEINFEEKTETYIKGNFAHNGKLISKYIYELIELKKSYRFSEKYINTFIDELACAKESMQRAVFESFRDQVQSAHEEIKQSFLHSFRNYRR